jgi:NTE family protein
VSIEPELILVSRASEVSDPLEPLTHLLAGAVARETGCATVIVTAYKGTFTVVEWQVANFVPSGAPLTPLVTMLKLRELIPRLPSWRGRVFIVNLEGPQDLPTGFAANVKFDRIVCVTDRIPDRIPPALELLLADSASGFSTFIPSVIVAPKSRSSPWWWPIPWSWQAPPFRARVMPDKATFKGTGSQAVAARLFRDAWHITLDRAALAASWALPRVGPFIDSVDPALRARAMRWSRAVTNRLVGIAVSGGGASAFRVTELLQQLADNNVPVDVLAGLSGGAFVGAYYCHGGVPKLHEAARWGPFLQVTFPVMLFNSWPMEFMIDLQLGSTRVGETDVRYAALATELPHKGRPESTVIEDGTLGEAARASGCLPPAFAPTRKNGRRYTDGGAAAVVPARIVRDCGADMTIAVNAIPGPATSNPLDWLPFGSLLRDYTYVGRQLDSWVWYAFMWTRISQRHGDEADVFLEFEGQQMPLIEGCLWWYASEIILEGGKDPNLGNAVTAAVNAWNNLPKC